MYKFRKKNKQVKDLQKNNPAQKYLIEFNYDENKHITTKHSKK